jgi:tRNA-2-methylthio-N6-dimethylallyladenosine synthase
MNTQLPKNPPRQVLIETWGCQMNVADSERMLALLAKDNYQRTEDPAQADLVILNTCHIREKARHKVVSRLGKLQELRANKKDLTIAVTGCVAQAEGKKLIASPHIDIIVGPGKIAELPNLVANHKEWGQKAMAIGFAQPEYIDPAELGCQKSAVELAPSLEGKEAVSRFITIQQGCNNFCTFCVVPFTRGGEISLLPRQIRAEAEAMVAAGVKEITLLGQNVNSYGHDLAAQQLSDNSLAAQPFVALLEDIASIPGLERLRFTTSNPHDLTPELAGLFAKIPQLGRHFHLPVQSGSDAVLSSMRRKVTRAEYLERVAWLRNAVPDMALSTDIIVGFPGESDEDFADTLSLLEQVRFGFIFAFTYSPRKGTAAIRFKDAVPEEVKRKRLRQLNELQDRITLELNQEEIGKTRQVLVHYRSKKNPDYYYGRTEHFRLVRIRSDEDIKGRVLPLLITSANKIALGASR